MKWFEIWFEDMEMIINTMVRNLQADLNAGYNPTGYLISKQRIDIEEKRRYLDLQLERFKGMEDNKVNRWCYYDLKKRGAI